MKERGDIMLRNPYTPGAGTPPSFLAGRDKTIEDIANSIKDTQSGSAAFHTVYYGLRGVGKTVLLNKIESLVKGNGDIYFDHIECGNLQKNESISKDITISIKKIVNKMSRLETSKELLSKVIGTLKAFTLTWNPNETTYTIGLNTDVLKGTSDTGDFKNDLTELIISVGEFAQKKQKMRMLIY